MLNQICRLFSSKKSQTLVIFTILMLSGCATQAPVQVATSDTQWQLKIDRYGHSVAAIGDKIFVMGGSSWGGRLANEIEIIDTLNRTSEVRRIKMIPRRYARAVSDGERYIYIVGGVYLGKKASLVPVIEKFDSQTFTVERITHHTTPKRNPAVAILDGKLYIAGGRSVLREGPKGYTNDLDIYDIAENTWLKGADMPRAVGSRATVSNSKIYIAGGYNGKTAIKNLMEYDPIKDEWKNITELPQKVSANSLVNVHNKLLVLGDYDNLDASYSYDFSKREWQNNVFKLKPARHSDAVVVGNNVFLIGGNIASQGSSLGHIQVLKLLPIEPH